MKILPEPYMTILQSALFIYLVYWYIRNWNKIEETDRDVANKTLQMIVLVFIMVFSCIAGIFFHANQNGLEKSFEIMKWIVLAIMLVGGLYLEFKYGHKKEIHTQRSNDHG